MRYVPARTAAHEARARNTPDRHAGRNGVPPDQSGGGDNIIKE